MQHELTLFEAIAQWTYSRRDLQSCCKAGVLICVLASSMLLASGCTASADDPIAVSLNENFELRAGESAKINSDNVEVSLLAITSDSRCGKGEVCITEGDAIVRISLQFAGQAKEEHELHTGSRMQSAVDFANLSVALVALNPPAISGRVIEAEAYVATLRVARGVSGGKVIY